MFVILTNFAVSTAIVLPEESFSERINNLTELNYECNEKINNLYFIEFYNNDILRTCLMPLYYITNCFQT